MERQPAEAIRNNVLGTRQLAQIASAHGVGAFVLISTDRAINPTSVMGATKRLAEIQLMAIAAAQGGRGAGAGGKEPIRQAQGGQGAGRAGQVANRKWQMARRPPLVAASASEWKGKVRPMQRRVMATRIL